MSSVFRLLVGFPSVTSVEAVATLPLSSVEELCADRRHYDGQDHQNQSRVMWQGGGAQHPSQAGGGDAWATGVPHSLSAEHPPPT